FAVFAIVACYDGLALAAPATSGADALFGAANIVDQLVTFVTVTAVVVALDDLPFVLRWVAGSLVAVMAIGVGEHFLGHSYAHAVGGLLPGQPLSTTLDAFQYRGGQLRARSAASFALELAWMGVLALPVLFAMTRITRGRERRAWIAGLALVVLAVYWTYSRSVLIGLPLIGAAFAAATRDRRVGRAVAAVVAAALLAALTAPTLFSRFSLSVDPSSIKIRELRLPFLLALVAPRAVHGLGFGGLIPSGLANPDNGYVLAYAEIGVVGLVGLGALLAAALVTSGRGLRATDPSARLAAGIGVTAVLGIAAAALAYNGFTAAYTVRLTWILVAIGVAAGQRAVGPAALPRPSWGRVAATAGVAEVLGLALYAAAPVHFAQASSFAALPVAAEDVPFNPVQQGEQLANTVCDLAGSVRRQLGGAQISCRDLTTGLGLGQLRVQAGTRTELRAAQAVLLDDLAGTPGLTGVRVIVERPPVAGITTGLRTAPLWLPLSALAVTGMLPRTDRRRRRAR
ncbi:MAG TPA: hypothetical protein VNE21_05855, partial [Mycobacteriales bacterium]|nr:hypothetical protein [Mycobacteriales bacterium]